MELSKVIRQKDLRTTVLHPKIEYQLFLYIFEQAVGKTVLRGESPVALKKSWSEISALNVRTFR